MPSIKFGTSGWRAVIADEFTVANVRRVLEAIARYVISAAAPSRPSLIVGYDTRFLSERFAADAANILAKFEIDPYLSGEAVPTPAIAYEIRRRHTQGGINFTASHNPPEYGGVKFSMRDGAPALPEVTRRIEANLADLEAKREISLPLVTPPGPGSIETVDLRPAYLENLAKKVHLDTIHAARLHVAYDPLYGTGRGYLDRVLRDAGIRVTTIHDHRDVLFGGHPPDPAEEHLQPLRKAMKETGAQLGLATDGDADRFGILDEGGAFISPNYIIALLLDYLLEARPWAGEENWTPGVGKTVATTHLVDAVANFHKIPVYETPVGFKYIGDLIEQDKIIIGGEESAGLTIRHHVPDKDGILACLLVAEMVASRGKSLSKQLHDLFRKVGSYYPSRTNVTLTENVKKRFIERSGQEYSSFEGRRVAKTVRTDGLKLIFDDGSWVLFRLSGTEPVCRLYCESHSGKDLEELREAAKRFLFG